MGNNINMVLVICLVFVQTRVTMQRLFISKAAGGAAVQRVLGLIPRQVSRVLPVLNLYYLPASVWVSSRCFKDWQLSEMEILHSICVSDGV